MILFPRCGRLTRQACPTGWPRLRPGQAGAGRGGHGRAGRARRKGLASPVGGEARLAGMDDATTMLTIGQLADRTGLPVRTIRYWSDIGAVPPAGRTGRDHRRYDAAAVARLGLV